MARKTNTQAETRDDWRRLIPPLVANAAEIPHLEAPRIKLERAPARRGCRVEPSDPRVGTHNPRVGLVQRWEKPRLLVRPGSASRLVHSPGTCGRWDGVAPWGPGLRKT